MPQGLQGPNLLPLLKNPQAAWEHAAFTSVVGPAGVAVSVRTERYRYTEWQKWRKSAELIDYSTDPDELANVAKKPEYRKTTLAMKRLLRAKLVLLRKAR